MARKQTMEFTNPFPPIGSNGTTPAPAAPAKAKGKPGRKSKATLEAEAKAAGVVVQKAKAEKKPGKYHDANEGVRLPRLHGQPLNAKIVSIITGMGIVDTRKQGAFGATLKQAFEAGCTRGELRHGLLQARKQIKDAGLRCRRRFVERMIDAACPVA